MRRNEWYFKIYTTLKGSGVALTYRRASYDTHDEAIVGLQKAIDEILELNIKGKKHNIHSYATPVYHNSINMELDDE